MKANKNGIDYGKELKERQMKARVYIITGYLMPFIIVFILGLMQGAWFDGENIMERDDVEVYIIPLWAFYVYYITLCFLSLVSVIILIKYFRMSSSKMRYFHIGFLSLLLLILFCLFVFTV